MKSQASRIGGLCYASARPRSGPRSDAANRAYRRMARKPAEMAVNKASARSAKEKIG